MCGVIGVIGPGLSNPHHGKGITHSSSIDKFGAKEFWAALDVYKGMLTLQHRGQDAAGIMSFDLRYGGFHQEKDLGLVAKVFKEERLKKLKGPMAIGHTRYATAGSDGSRDLQPMASGYPYGIGMIHNGNLVNYHTLRREALEKYKLQLLSTNDIEAILQYWCQFLLKQGVQEGQAFTFEKGAAAARELHETLDGAYAVVGMVAGEGLVAFRDPKGIRPLVLGRNKVSEDKYAYCVCSETVTLNFLGYEYVRDVEPGEFLFINGEGEIHSETFKRQEKKAHCMFEWVYFSGAESSIEGTSVYRARLRLGNQLAEKVKSQIEEKSIAPDIVVPVPDTSRTAAIALAESLKLPYREGLIKNRYIQRSFILSSQEQREKAVELKLSPIRSEIEGKNILLVDDSVVRGTTSKKIIQLLKKYGANEITLAITCPPIRYGCFYGIDFADQNELVANDKNLEQIADWIGAAKVVYIDEDDLREAIGTDELCMGCLNNQYPTDVKDKEEFKRLRKNRGE